MTKKSEEIQKLRYPNAQIEDDTDFLEIKVVRYEAPKFDNQNFLQPTSSKPIEKNIETPLAYIFLPIPENIQDSNAVNWGADSLNGLAARGIGAAAKVIGDNGSIIDAGKAVFSETKSFLTDVAGISDNIRNSYIAAKAVGALTNVNAQGVITRQTGQVLNPNMELLFNNVTLRSFNFQFDLAPRDKKESEK